MKTQENSVQRSKTAAYMGFGNRLADGRAIGYKPISAVVPA